VVQITASERERRCQRSVVEEVFWEWSGKLGLLWCKRPRRLQGAKVERAGVISSRMGKAGQQLREGQRTAEGGEKGVRI
jgi:hypothetical protein